MEIVKARPSDRMIQSHPSRPCHPATIGSSAGLVESVVQVDVAARASLCSRRRLPSFACDRTATNSPSDVSTGRIAPCICGGSGTSPHPRGVDATMRATPCSPDTQTSPPVPVCMSRKGAIAVAPDTVVEFDAASRTASVIRDARRTRYPSNSPATGIPCDVQIWPDGPREMPYTQVSGNPSSEV
jgi:hypothetical protein